MNNLPRVVTRSVTAGNRTRDLQVASLTPNIRLLANTLANANRLIDFQNSFTGRFPRKPYTLHIQWKFPSHIGSVFVPSEFRKFECLK